MKIPTTLKHKPVYVVEDYEKLDGRTAGNTDAKGLSLGLAQWNDRGRVDISAKVWRYTGEKWSRQSEELPLHRVLDLMLLILSARRHQHEAYRHAKGYDPGDLDIARIPLQGEGMTASICAANPMIDEDIALFAQAMAEDDELVSERLHRIADLLTDMGYGGAKPRDGKPEREARPAREGEPTDGAEPKSAQESAGGGEKPDKAAREEKPAKSGKKGKKKR